MPTDIQQTEDQKPIRGRRNEANEQRLAAHARTALQMRYNDDLPTVVKAFGEALVHICQDATDRGYAFAGLEHHSHFINSHPLTLVFASRIGELTRSGGPVIVASGVTSLADAHSDAIEAVEGMMRGERVRWFVPGIAEPDAAPVKPHSQVLAEAVAYVQRVRPDLACTEEFQDCITVNVPGTEGHLWAGTANETWGADHYADRDGTDQRDSFALTDEAGQEIESGSADSERIARALILLADTVVEKEGLLLEK